MIEICPKCNQKSLIKTPHTRIMTEKLGCMLNTSNTYSYVCHNKNCNYTSDIINVKTEIGEKLSKPWYQRIFLFMVLLTIYSCDTDVTHKSIFVVDKVSNDEISNPKLSRYLISNLNSNGVSYFWVTDSTGLYVVGDIIEFHKK